MHDDKFTLAPLGVALIKLMNHDKSAGDAALDNILSSEGDDTERILREAYASAGLPWVLT